MFEFLSSMGAAIKDLAAPILQAIGIGVSSKTQQETNAANAAINQTNLDYNTAMTREQWERDDNAHQREVADLQAAGLSPIASLNGAQTSGALGAPSPIAMAAPQLDFNSLAQSMLGAQQLQEQKREFDITKGQKDTELENNAKMITAEIEHMQNLDEYNKQNLTLLAKSNELKAREIQNAINQLNENKRQFNEKYRLDRDKEDFNQLAKRIDQVWNSVSPDAKKYYGLGVKGFKSINELEIAQSQMDAVMQQMLKELGALGNQDNSFGMDVSASGSVGNKLIAGAEGEVNAEGSFNYKLDEKRKAIIAKYSKQMYFPKLITEDDADLYDSNGFLRTAKVKK